jgi:chemotaxis protein CheX
MRLFLITSSVSTGNIVTNTLSEAGITDVDIRPIGHAAEIGDTLGDDALVVVDWEETSPEALADEVKAVRKREDGEDTPVLLLCSKRSSNTTFPGMKAGANGVLQKPIEARSFVKALADARKNSKKGKGPTINVEFINPFIEATRTVFSTMAGIEAERQKLYLKQDHKMLGDISGVMGLSGTASGSVVVSLPEKLAIRLVGAMLGEDMGTELNQDVSDGVGEIINMIAGQAKASLTKTKYHFQISIPTVVMGQGHEITHKKGTPNIVVLFSADGDEQFAVQVCLSPEDEKEG